MSDEPVACVNTDRELYRESGHEAGDAYADSIFVTKEGGIGMRCGGFVIVKPIRAWFECARTHPLAGGAVSEAMVEDLAKAMCKIDDGDWETLMEEDPVFENQGDYRHKARAALEVALSTPAASVTATNENFGYVFDNPDTGEEYSPNHPLMSGECDDAENIRFATAQEQTLWNALQERFQQVEDLKHAPPASAGSEGDERLRKEAEGIIDMWIEEEDEGQEPNEAVTISTSISELSILKTALLPMRITTPPNADALPQDVINLVIAAREVMDAGHTGEEFDALLYAAEAFSSRVPYENYPTDEGDGPSTGAFIAAVSRADELRNPTGLDAALNAVTANADEAGLLGESPDTLETLAREIEDVATIDLFGMAIVSLALSAKNRDKIVSAMRRVAQSPAVGDGADGCYGLDTLQRVRFYERDFYPLSNFSAFHVTWRGIDFDTSEAAYHWEKFNPPVYQCSDGGAVRSAILLARSAHDTFKIAEQYRSRRRPDWDEVKVGIMREIIRAKADQHEYVKRKLLATEDRELIEDSWRDDFWGWGPNRDGQNMLGKLWMELRAEFRALTPAMPADGGK